MASHAKFPWRRPEGPVNVWKVVDGQERLKDGATKPIKFSIQEVPDDRRNEALEFMIKYFIVDEPICKSLNVKNDPQMIHDFRVLWSYCLEQGIVEAAYVLEEHGQITELASINMLCVMSKEVAEDMSCLQESYRSAKFIKVMDIMEKYSKKASALRILNVDKYISAFGLNVSPRFRGQKLGLRMIEARNEIGKKYAIPASSTVFTALASQILAERAGYKLELAQNYAEIIDDKGQPFFPNIETECMKIMMTRLHWENCS